MKQLKSIRGCCKTKVEQQPLQYVETGAYSHILLKTSQQKQRMQLETEFQMLISHHMSC